MSLYVFATYGAPLSVCRRELLGHASIGTTQIDTKLGHLHLARIYDQVHPRAKRRG